MNNKCQQKAEKLSAKKITLGTRRIFSEELKQKIGK